jgi:hypothetical protein
LGDTLDLPYSSILKGKKLASFAVSSAPTSPHADSERGDAPPAQLLRRRVQSVLRPTVGYHHRNL